MHEKRSSPRKTDTCPATIKTGHGDISCTIIDISNTGAKVRLQSGAFLSGDCHVVGTLFPGTLPARIVWRRGLEIGLRFKAAIQLRGVETKRSFFSKPVVAGRWPGRP